MKQSEAFFLATAFILAAVLGGMVGEVVGHFLPPGAVKTLFEKSVQIGFDTVNLSLYALSLTFGIMIKLNFVSLLFVLLVLAYYRWWYI